MDRIRNYIRPMDMSDYANYTVNPGAATDHFQHMYRAASHDGSFGRQQDGQEEILDLSRYHHLSPSAIDNVQLQDVIKPQEAGPWSGAQPPGQQSGQFSTDWSGSAAYAKSEPVPKQDNCYMTHTDSGYGTESIPQWDTHNAHMGTTMEVDYERRSACSDSRVYKSHRVEKRKPPPCSHCGKQPKNQSDAKKHDLSHQKPYHCYEPGCSRKEGFATENDRQRHRKSVHGQVPSVGSRSGFVCVACPPPEGALRKFWPRKDNFKAHIKRKHPNEHIEDLVERSQTTQPEDTATVKTFDDSVALGSQIDPHDVVHNPYDASPGLSRHPSDQGYHSWQSNSSMPTETLIGGMQGHLQYQTSPIQHAMSHDNGLDILDDNPQTLSYSGHAFNTSQFNLQRQDNHMFPSPSQIRPSITNFSGDMSAPCSNNTQSASSVSPPQGGEFECAVCHKRKRRDCDLKKHMKRHTRPYGCTFPSCQKKFGSRNDWKRHESSQHFLEEMWKCGQALKDGNKCMRPPFQRKESLVRHLRSPCHGMQDSSKIEEACKHFRLGKEGHDHYWCGFCEKLIEQPKGTQQAWDERFKHIGDHFDKGGLDSGDWMCIKENKKKRYVTQIDAKDGKRRCKDEGSDDELDLDDYDLGVASVATASQPGMLAAAGVMLPPASPVRSKASNLDGAPEVFGR